METNTVQIVTSDRLIFYVDRQITKMCTALLTADFTGAQVEVQMKANEFRLLLAYCEHHNYTKVVSDILRPLKSKTLKGCVTDPFDREFIETLGRD